MIIAAHAGTGKTTLAKIHPDKVVDFTAGSYKYLPNPAFENLDPEEIKAHPNSCLNWEYPGNYVEAIKQAMGDGRVFVIPSCSMVRRLLRSEGIPYILCYPQRNAKEVYRKRYIDRGNTSDFLDVFIGGWDSFIDRLEEDDYGEHIVLKPHEYLIDAIGSIRLCPNT